jgi:cobalt-zinc-cadmium efflux system protein
VHHVHVWRLNDDAIHLEAHVLLKEDLLISDFENLNYHLANILADDFNIGHAVLQPEFNGCSNQNVVAQE